jgi:hypothetical protein
VWDRLLQRLPQHGPALFAIDAAEMLLEELSLVRVAGAAAGSAYCGVLQPQQGWSAGTELLLPQGVGEAWAPPDHAQKGRTSTYSAWWYLEPSRFTKPTMI